MGNELIQVDEHVTKPGSGRKLKTMLLFPPEWVPTAPYLALPSLTAVLREAGHEVIQKDVNIDMYNLFFSDMFLIWVSARMSQQFKTLESKEAKANPEWDLALDYYFTVKEGLGVEDAEKVFEEFEQNHYTGWDLKIFIREYVFLYVAHFGTNKLPVLQIQAPNEEGAGELVKV